jgi:fucose permease
MNSQAVEVERRSGRAIMSSFHGLFSLGGLAGAAVAALLEWLGVGERTHVVAATAAGLLVLAAAMPFLAPARATASGTPLFVRPTGVLRTLGLLAFAALLAEGSMADWSAVYLRDSLGSSMHVAAIGFAAFSLTMAIGRLSGDAIVRRFGSTRVLRASATVAAVGLAVALLIGAPAAGIVGCAAVGLGIANIFPILLSRAGRLEGVEPSMALAAVTATGYFGFLAGPPLIGVAAELTSLPVALGIVAAFCALIAAVPLELREPSRVEEMRDVA